MDANLATVRDRLAPAILDFCAAKLGSQFHAGELLNYIQMAGIPTSPDSPSRVLRHLRIQGKINYHLVSRAHSLYKVTNVEGVTQ